MIGLVELNMNEKDKILVVQENNGRWSVCKLNDIAWAWMYLDGDGDWTNYVGYGLFSTKEDAEEVLALHLLKEAG